MENLRKIVIVEFDEFKGTGNDHVEVYVRLGGSGEIIAYKAVSGDLKSFEKYSICSQTSFIKRTMQNLPHMVRDYTDPPCHANAL